MGACPFCARFAPAFYGGGREPISNDYAAAFEPLNPVTPGHLLVVPFKHVEDALEDPALTGAVMTYAAQLATPDCNLITSIGSAATQTVRHLHIHIVPRRVGDGLALPWTGQDPAPGPFGDKETQQ